MDTNYYTEILKRCFKCDDSVIKNLNVVYNSSNSTFVLWNKFQIFVYENFEFECAAKIIIPEFQVQCLLASNNYLICLDSGGNIQVTSLKFKNPSQKRFKTCFQMREQGVMACLSYSQDLILSVKSELNTYFLILNKTNTEFQFVKKILLMFDQDWEIKRTNCKYIFNSYLISEEHSESVKKALKVDDNIQREWSLLVMSFDKTVIYNCLFNPKMSGEPITLVKLYTCPSEICSIEIIEGADVSIIIGLTIGTMIRLSLLDLTKDPDVVHLNSAMHQLLFYNNTAIYTDGITMWKAENVFSKNIKFTKLFVRHVNDFLKFGDQIICTTFSNLIYTFHIDDESSYIKLQTTDEYCSAEKLINNAEYLQRIMEEVDKNSTLVTMLNKEGSYITALSLSNRQDIMNNIIICKVSVYEDYEEAITENTEAKLTEDFVNYHNTDTFLFLINIETVLDHKFDDVLSNELGDVKIHITLSTEMKILKTTSIRITEQLKKLSLLIPLKVTNMELIQINVNIKILSNIPGVFDAKQMMWTVLYRKDIILKSEHFIKTNFNSNRCNCLKESQESLEEQTKQVAVNLYGNLFEFNEVPTNQRPDWALYVKLPKNFKTMLNCKEYYERKFNSKRTNYLLQQFSEEFYLSKSSITFVINNEKVNIQIENDGFSSPLLKISCRNMKIALNLRNFFANVVYKDFVNIDLEMEAISSTFYTTVENLQKAVQKCVGDSSQNEQLFDLIEQFERHVMGSLPM